MKILGNEIWRDIPGFEGLYQISNLGQVKSIRYKRFKILKQITKKGYKYARVYKDGKQHYLRIHRIVAMVFIDNPKNYPIINHIDENKGNNCVDNLEWCTVRYNNNYGSGSKKRAEKRSIPVACFRSGKMVKIYPSVKSTREDDFKPGAVSKVCRGQMYSHHGCEFRYISKSDYNKINPINSPCRD